MENESPAPAPSSYIDRAEALMAKFETRLSETRQKAAVSSPASANTTEKLPTERADEILSNAGEKLGRWASAVSQQARRSFAFVREEAEDLWAEAQSKSASASAADSQSASALDAPTDPLSSEAAA